MVLQDMTQVSLLEEQKLASLGMCERRDDLVLWDGDMGKGVLWISIFTNMLSMCMILAHQFYRSFRYEPVFLR